MPLCRDIDQLHRNPQLAAARDIRRSQSRGRLLRPAAISGPVVAALTSDLRPPTSDFWPLTSGPPRASVAPRAAALPARQIAASGRRARDASTDIAGIP